MELPQRERSRSPVRFLSSCQARLVPAPFTAPKPDGWTRFVCFSDTHGRHREIPREHQPQADVLLHAGDFTDVGQLAQIQDFSSWLRDYPASHKVCIAGNHDISMQPAYYPTEAAFARARHNYDPDYDIQTYRDALRHCVYLEDSSVSICGYQIFGSPWQPEFCNWAFNIPDLSACALRSIRPHLDLPPVSDNWFGNGGGGWDQAVAVRWEVIGQENNGRWPTRLRLTLEGFRPELQGDYVLQHGEEIANYPVWHQEGGAGRLFSTSGRCCWSLDTAQGDAARKWAEIPNDTDILITHGPPRGFGDLCSNGAHAGCPALLEAIRCRSVPVHLAGHIHEGAGAVADGGTLFINASTCTLQYRPAQPPFVFDLPPREQLRVA